MRALALLFCLVAVQALAFDPVDPSPGWRRGALTTPYSARADAELAQCIAAVNPSAFVCGEVDMTPTPPCGSTNCPLNPAASTYWNAKCQVGAGSCAQYAGSIYQLAECATGTTAVDGFCVPNVCVTNAGKEADFEVTWIGGSSDANPSGACVDNCEMTISSGARFDVTLATGTRYNAYKGMGVMTTAACSAGSRTGNATTAYRAIASGGGNVSGTGGVGSSGGGTTTSGQGFNKTDAINLAKIATNTSQLASGGVTTSTVITSTNEGSTGTSDTNTQAAISAEHAAVSTALDAGDAALAAAGTQSFLPGEGRWLFGLGGFFPAVAECSMDVGTVPMTTRADLHLVIDFCDKVGWAQDFMYWTFGLMTLMGIWSMVFASKESA